MNVVAASVLLGSLYLCRSSTAQTLDDLKHAARNLKTELPCGKWDCSCAFGRPRGCCCAANEMFDVETESWDRMVRLWGQITTLNTNARSLEAGMKYAFRATMDPSIANSVTKCFGRFTTDVPVPYTIVPVNDNNAYNPTLGIYTAQQNGVFVFTYTVYSMSHSQLIHTAVLMMNGEPQVVIAENNRDDTQDSGAQMVTLALRKGDQVYVLLKSGKELCGELDFNTFTGFILYADIDYLYSAKEPTFLSYY